MFKVLVWIVTRTWRIFISWLINLYFTLIIILKGRRREINNLILEMKRNVNSLERVEEYYSKYYTQYYSDPFSGLIDWEPTIATLIYRKKDDCDGMAKLFNFLFTCLMNNTSLEENSYRITSYTFWANINLVKRMRKMHVMCVLYWKDKYFLGDYRLHEFESMFQIKEHYAHKYFNNTVNASDIDYLRLP